MIMAYRGVVDAVVYGVVVEGREGRAGMAAIVVDDTFQLDFLKAHLELRLPTFARPLFIRLCTAIPMTGTFKLKKEDLALEGANIRKYSDQVWFHGPGEDNLLLCNEELMHDVSSGTIKI